MSDIETLLRRSFAYHHDTVSVDNDLFDRAITHGLRRARRRHLAIGGAAATVVVALVASLAIIVSMRGTDESDLPVSDASAAWWSAVDMADPSIFSGDGDTFINQITPWRDQLVVLGVIQPSSGSTAAYAWTTDDGVNWERRQQNLPAGCFSNGVVALDDRLVVTCTIHDTSPDGVGARIGLATTSDLESWMLTPISDDSRWFGSLIGEGPDGAVVVLALEADDPNTTRGSTTRIWSSGDLARWTPIEGEAPTTMVDASAASIRTFDGHIVVTGVFNDWADQGSPDQPDRMIPAIWVSTDGSPFVRTLLGSSDGSTGPSTAVMDMVSNGSAYVAVGTAGDPPDGLAWTSPDLVDWSTVTVASDTELGSEVDPASRSVWAVVALPDGTLLAAGDGHPGGGSIAGGWMSNDGGASWRTVGVSPDLLSVWNGRAVGMTSAFGSEPTFWSWAGGIPAGSSDSAIVDLGSADDLEVGEVRWYAEHRLYLVRTDSAVLALAQKSPQQGCRLALATDLDLGDIVPDGAVFSDPCHGASFALDGTHLAGPSPRDMDHFRVESRAGRITADTTRLLPAPTEG